MTRHKLVVTPPIRKKNLWILGDGPTPAGCLGTNGPNSQSFLAIRRAVALSISADTERNFARESAPFAL